MTGTKRASGDSGATTRASKAAKTDSSSTPAKGRKSAKKGAKAALPASTFKTTALPLHVSVTHTPPAIPDPNDSGTPVPTDPGFIGNLTLVPTSFATGSYGWKGSKRITVELQNSDGGGEKEKVHVMLTINATVSGSKQAKTGDEDGEVEDPKNEEESADVVPEKAPHAENIAENAVEKGDD